MKDEPIHEMIYHFVNEIDHRLGKSRGLNGNVDLQVHIHHHICDHKTEIIPTIR